MLKHSTTLKPGATAPDFSLPTNRGDQRTLAGYLVGGQPRNIYRSLDLCYQQGDRRATCAFGWLVKRKLDVAGWLEMWQPR